MEYDPHLPEAEAPFHTGEAAPEGSKQKKLKLSKVPPQTGKGVPGDGRVPKRLQAASFFCGAAVMVLELTGSRLVAPFLGTSLVVWTALIGVMMTSLCAGNWLGGCLADRRPEARLLGRILLLAAAILGATAFASNAILTALLRRSFNLYLTSVAAALAIFTPTTLLLGMTSPFIARLALRDVASSGGTVGRLSALNAAGSILGTFRRPDRKSVV